LLHDNLIYFQKPKKLAAIHRQTFLYLLFKNPNTTNVERSTLIIVVLVAIVEIEVPRVGGITGNLGRAPA
jgi:hypothetical protein